MIEQAIKSGTELSKFRGRLGMTQTALAKSLGMTLRGIQKLEAGQSKVRQVHSLALEAMSLVLAVDRNEPTLALPRIRRTAKALTD